MRYVTGALAVVLLIAMLVFAIQNRETVGVSFAIWSLSMPKVFLILGTYVLGMLTGVGVVELTKRVMT
jgi:lipopolysaccharide assembly protein A